MKMPPPFTFQGKEYESVESPSVGCIGCAFETMTRRCKVDNEVPMCVSAKHGEQYVVIFVEKGKKDELV